MRVKRKVLVVEDNPINREILCGILEAEYETLQAENGQEALDVLKHYGEDISLVLLDIVMPVMDGYAFLSIVKNDPAYASIPVIVTPQNDGEADEITALAHGASDFVAKPYRPQVILHRVANIIHLRETAAMLNLMRHDRLTSLYSKEHFYHRAREILLENPHKAYDIICSDIVNFKIVNDIFGAAMGDELLRAVAEIYLQRVGDRGICGRLQGDQFVCLIDHRYEYTDEIFESATQEICKKFSMKNIALKWGVYHITDRTLEIEQMCDRALLAVQSIKGQYGKPFAVYGDALREQLMHNQAIVDSMEDALAQEQFEVYLQPKNRIADGALIGAEALVRWNHPQWGLLMPGEFIPLFEKNGFVTKLDQYVWDKAAAILHSWQEKCHMLVPISVNVSRADIYNTDLADALTKIVEKNNISASDLHLEITESAYTENSEQIVEMVKQLRAIGFVIEMDDFGSGYSSLNMLNTLPIDILKLDKSFLRDEMEKPANQGILKFIMSLARWLNLVVVAEGVETKEQLEQLGKLGCDCAQGYYFSKPVPVPEFEKMMQRVTG